MRSQGNIVKAQVAAAAVGDGAIVSLAGRQNLIVQVSGTFVGTVLFQGSLDGTNWVNMALAALNSTTRARATSATAPGIWMLDQVAGLELFKARVDAYTSGAIDVWVRASD